MPPVLGKEGISSIKLASGTESFLQWCFLILFPHPVTADHVASGKQVIEVKNGQPRLEPPICSNLKFACFITGPVQLKQHCERRFGTTALDDLISSLSEDSAVREVHTCVFWTAVLAKHCGLASTFHEPHPQHRAVKNAGNLTKLSALELAQYARSDNVLEASIGVAAINSLIDIDEARCVEENAFDVLALKGKDKDIAVVGHFPWIPELRSIARTLWVVEQNPQEGELPAEEAEEVLPQADVVGLTGTSLLNHTIDRLLDLSKSSFVVMVGPTTPLSPVLFDYGVDILAGVNVIEADKTISSISQGAIFSQVEGVRLVTMAKERKNGWTS